MIKALAHATKRSVVNIPLSRISTNAELQSIIFDKRYHVQNESLTLKLDFKDVIFCIEDVDATSDIVKRRDGGPPRDKPSKVQVPAQGSIWDMLVRSSHSDAQKLVKTLMEKSEQLRSAFLEMNVLEESANRILAVPGLAAVGQAGDDPNLKALGEHSIQAANKLLGQYSSIDKIVGTHARAMRDLLDLGAIVDDGFVAALLGESTPCLQKLSYSSSFSDEDDTANTGVSTPVNENDESQRQQQQQQQLLVNLSRLMDSRARMTADESGDAKGPIGSANPASAFSFLSDSGQTDDKLSLSGLLNVLDGVVDSPGRIIVMTTNHPEHLDPALIRPGRIDKKLLLGYMEAPDIILMLQHYFEVELTDKQKQRVVDCCVPTNPNQQERLQLTPAQVEQLTIEHEAVEDMIVALESQMEEK